jgi:outer membrane protein OmpA-like peptidoglycan-associated protein
MSIRLTVTLAISLLILGASYAFADGILNDASTTRAHGGVGNYLFWSMHEDSGKNELVNNEALFESAPAPNGPEELRIHQASAVAPLHLVRFENGSSRIRDSEIPELRSIANTLKSDPNLKARIIGYSDRVGPAARNEALAGARAEAVVRDLKARGVSENQLSWNSKGESGDDHRVEVHFE